MCSPAMSVSDRAIGQGSAGPPFGGKQHQTTDEEKENWREGDRFSSNRGRKVGADTELIRPGWTEGGNKKKYNVGRQDRRRNRWEGKWKKIEGEAMRVVAR